ncbi:unnamed protein product [marine sediment metagenome]|uniref:Uncharacterized protein n=1 Tax=marine sediment metagenome TaxID=412755 RepID=X1SK46_9ZZZZ
MKIAYKLKRWTAGTLALATASIDVVTEYQADGMALTLRQLYYQLVARALLPNTQRDYKRLGVVVSDARLCGMLDWSAIEDRGRNVIDQAHWSSPAEIVGACAEQYRVDTWATQAYRPEVWVEKEALIGVVADAAEPLDVPAFACKGYTSQSELWRAGMRMVKHLENGQAPVVVHLGDHDPSGIDMTRDITDRLRLFVEHHRPGEHVDVVRIALNLRPD